MGAYIQSSGEGENSTFSEGKKFMVVIGLASIAFICCVGGLSGGTVGSSGGV